MSGIPKRGKRDANEPEIVEALRAAGCTVRHLSASGLPDLLVGCPDGSNVLLEVKTRTGKLTADEETFFDTWIGDAFVVRTVEEALQAVGRL